MRKTGQFNRNGGNKQRKNLKNRQENSSPKKSNQNSNQGNSASGNTGSRNSGSKRKALHPWVSSSQASSQALTSHISMVNKNQSGGNGNNRNKQQGQKRKNTSRQQRENGNNGGARPRNHFGKPKQKENRNKANIPSENTRNTSGSEKKLAGGLDAFTLFCAYHLGIGPNKEYKPTNINEIARRFGQDQGVVKQALKDCNMDSASLLDRDFDMALAQLDIQVAPEGIDKMELAKSIYEDFLEAPSVKRDWKKIIEEDRKENRKVFG
ncbi:MAG: hypothetical protein F3743_06475 [Nitrospinae bacterium]|nr:hypothetical protein [Nitrospinota bacterium]MZH05031.1 hypothetical protein [Nitrospinota bacterium]MZH14639.1 hypothetical protein [Nitrospinota bacterium]